MARRRKLRPEERELWEQVAKSADPLHRRRPEPEDTPTPPRLFPNKPDPHRIEAFEIGTRSRGASMKNDVMPAISDQITRQPVQMDAKAFSKMKRGKLAPESRIDLHGMTIAQAQPVLTRFILNAHAQGKRLVLVITGKGKHNHDDGPIPQRMGVLRHEVPHWLRSGVLRQLVLQIAQAHPSHGGGGAYYVYLRRQK